MTWLEKEVSTVERAEVASAVLGKEDGATSASGGQSAGRGRGRARGRGGSGRARRSRQPEKDGAKTTKAGVDPVKRQGAGPTGVKRAREVYGQYFASFKKVHKARADARRVEDRVGAKAVKTETTR